MSMPIKSYVLAAFIRFARRRLGVPPDTAKELVDGAPFDYFDEGFRAGFRKGRLVQRTLTIEHLEKSLPRAIRKVGTRLAVMDEECECSHARMLHEGTERCLITHCKCLSFRKRRTST